MLGYLTLLISLFIKGTQMQIWKSSDMFMFIKLILQNLLFWILRILKLFTHKFCNMFIYKHTKTIYVKK